MLCPPLITTFPLYCILYCYLCYFATFIYNKEFVKLLCILCIFLCDLHDVKRCSYGPCNVSGSQGTNDGIQEHHVLLPGLEFVLYEVL